MYCEAPVESMSCTPMRHQSKEELDVPQQENKHAKDRRPKGRKSKTAKSLMIYFNSADLNDILRHEEEDRTLAKVEASMHKRREEAHAKACLDRKINNHLKTHLPKVLFQVREDEDGIEADLEEVADADIDADLGANNEMDRLEADRQAAHEANIMALFRGGH